MIELAAKSLWLAQWVVFLAMIAGIAYVAMRIARQRGADKAKQRKTGLVVGAIAFVLLNVLNIQALAGKYYFEHLCKTEAGEFIYKTVDNVEGLYQMRPRDPRDYFDRVRAGDIPEDPYGHTNGESQHPELLFINPPFHNYRFLEAPLPTSAGAQPTEYRRYSGYQQDGTFPAFISQFGYPQTAQPMQVEQVATRKSRYGFTWQGIDHPVGKMLGVYGGETVVQDLQTGEVLARKRGFVQFHGDGGVCPAAKDDSLMYDFISKVLRPPPPIQKRASGESK